MSRAEITRSFFKHVRFITDFLTLILGANWMIAIASEGRSESPDIRKIVLYAVPPFIICVIAALVKRLILSQVADVIYSDDQCVIETGFGKYVVDYRDVREVEISSRLFDGKPSSVRIVTEIDGKKHVFRSSAFRTFKGKAETIDPKECREHFLYAKFAGE